MSIMENQMEKKAESELQTGFTIDPASFRVFRNRGIWLSDL